MTVVEYYEDYIAVLMWKDVYNSLHLDPEWPRPSTSRRGALGHQHPQPKEARVAAAHRCAGENREWAGDHGHHRPDYKPTPGSSPPGSVRSSRRSRAVGSTPTACRGAWGARGAAPALTGRAHGETEARRVPGSPARGASSSWQKSLGDETGSPTPPQEENGKPKESTEGRGDARQAESLAACDREGHLGLPAAPRAGNPRAIPPPPSPSLLTPPLRPPAMRKMKLKEVTYYSLVLPVLANFGDCLPL
ncbi:uncharacterized protein LOC124244941 [Equus quagga]|uniref:uncharacterized protein LOC124244941 n=1 Tax=Equus quagga TaxID=89248 RepID=UPI001EE36206|nr:uncharacterized protein LOC124244941 [Equus quagga]